MDAQESLDHSIDQHISGGNQASPIDEEISSMLAAAKMLLQLREIALPPGFAHRLEVSLRAHIRNLNGQ